MTITTNITITTDDDSSNIQSNFDEIEIIRVKKPKTNIFKKFLNLFKRNKKHKQKNTSETENEITNYNTVTSCVSFSLPSSLTALNSTSTSTSSQLPLPFCKSSTATVKFIPNQFQPSMPSILNRSLFVSPSDDAISEADTEITLVDSIESLNKKKNQLKKKKGNKGKEEYKRKHKRRHSWQDDSFNEHMEDPRSCRTITNIKEILNGSSQFELHTDSYSSTIETILTNDFANKLGKEIPRFYRETCKHWYLEYSLGEHGASITTFYENQMYCESPIIIAIVDSYGEMFGAYLNEPFNPNNTGFNGNRECFLWKNTSSGIKTYHASSINEYYMLSDPDFIAMGVDENGVFGLFLDSMLLNGESSPCDTYLNEILSSKKRFECASLEVWSLQYE